MRKLNELTGGHNHGHGGGDEKKEKHGHGGGGVPDYSNKGEDKYLDILKDKDTLHYDLDRLETLNLGKKKKPKEHGHGGGHGHGDGKKKKPKKKNGIIPPVSYKEEHAGHGHFEDKINERMTDANINAVIKAKAIKRYGPSSAQTEQY